MLKYLLELQQSGGRFHMEPTAFLGHAQLVRMMLARKIPVATASGYFDKKEPEYYDVHAASDSSLSLGISSTSGSKLVGKIHVLSIHGVLVQQGGECSYGMMDYRDMLLKAEMDPAVIAHVIRIYSPGGAVLGTKPLADMVGRVDKPIIGYVDELATSGAFWTIAPSDHIMLSSENATVGSIGTVLEYLDYTKWLEEQGIEEVVITADGADNKRKYNFSLPSDADKALIKKELLNPVNVNFQDAIKEARPFVNQQALQADMYMGNDAIKMGLADSIGTLTDAIQLAAYLATEREKESNVSPSTSTNGTMKNNWKTKMANARKAFGISAKGQPANTEDPFAELSREDLIKHIQNLQKENKEMHADLDELTQEVIQLGEQPAAASVADAAVNTDLTSEREGIPNKYLDPVTLAAQKKFSQN
ncbi:MAG: S49 family peptidase [Bacteroidota bacterium]